MEENNIQQNSIQHTPPITEPTKHKSNNFPLFIILGLVLFIFLSLGVFILYHVVLQHKNTGATQWKTYNGKDYSIDYPPDWSANYTNGDMFIKSPSYIEALTPDSVTKGAVLNVSNLPYGNTIETAVRSNYSDCAKKDLVKMFMVDGYKAAWYSTDCPGNNPDKIGILVENSNNGLFLEYDYQPRTDSKNLEIFNHMLSTIKFKKSEQPNMSNWKTTKNVQYGFQIEFPSSWFAVDYGKYPASKLGIPDPSEKLLLLFGRGLEPKDLPAFTHPWGNLQINITTKLFSEQELNKTGLEQGKIVNEQVQNKSQYKVIQFAGVKANKKIQLSADLVEGNLGTEIIFNSNGYGWLIDYPAVDYNGNNDPIYDQILSTFKFIVPPSQMVGFNEYSNPILKFQVQYPDGWEHNQPDAEHVGYWDEFDNKKNTDDPNYMQMIILLESLSDKYFTASPGTNIVTMEEGTYYTKVANLSINGNQAVKYIDHQAPNDNSNILGYFVKTNTQNGFAIEFSAFSKQMFDSNLALFNTIANSFVSFR